MTDAAEDTFYDYWHAAHAAIKAGTALPPVQDGKPQGGYYRMRTIKDGPWLPVAIYKDAGRVVVLVQEQEVTFSNKVWLSCARHPVAYEHYTFFCDNGHWPGETTAPTERTAQIGDNAPPAESIETILPRELDAVRAWIEANEIESDDLAHEAANKVGELRKLKVRAEEAHKVEKEPNLKEGREIDARFLPSVKRAEVAIKFLLDKVTAFANKKIAAERKAAAESEAERQRQIKEIEERAIAAAREAATAGRQPVEGAELALQAPVTLPPPPPPPVKQAYGGVTGNKISARTKIVAVIVDQDACYAHFKTNPTVIELLQKLAQKLVDAKQPVPGVTTEERSEVR